MGLDHQKGKTCKRWSITQSLDSNSLLFSVVLSSWFYYFPTGGGFGKARSKLLTEGEVARIFETTLGGKQANTNGRASYEVKHTAADRDKLILMVMLDTGITSEEVAQRLEGDLASEETVYGCSVLWTKVL